MMMMMMPCYCSVTQSRVVLKVTPGQSFAPRHFRPPDRRSKNPRPSQRMISQRPQPNDPALLESRGFSASRPVGAVGLYRMLCRSHWRGHPLDRHLLGTNIHMPENERSVNTMAVEGTLLTQLTTLAACPLCESRLSMFYLGFTRGRISVTPRWEFVHYQLPKFIAL